MNIQNSFQRFTTSNNTNPWHSEYIGINGELTWDPQNGLRLHDGSTTGGVQVGGTSNISTFTNTVHLNNGDDVSGSHANTQIALGYNGSTFFSHFITTRHYSGGAAGNAIQFYTNDGTESGLFPTNAILGLTIDNGSITTGSITTNSGITVGAGGITVTAGGINVDNNAFSASSNSVNINITEDNGPFNPPSIHSWSFTNGGLMNLAGGTAQLMAQPNIVGLYPDGWNSSYNSVEVATNSYTRLANQNTVEIRTNYGVVPTLWTFQKNGTLTFPDSTTQHTAWTGGRVVSVPTHSTGASGDKAGDIAFDPNGMYYCKYNFTATVHTVTSVTTGGVSRGFITIYEGTNGFTSADMTNYTISGPNGYTGTVTGPTINTSGTSWDIPVSPNLQQAQGTYTFTSPTGNIWVKVAWSNATW